ETVRTIELTRRGVGHPDLERDGGSAERPRPVERVLEKDPSVPELPEPRVGRDLVDVELVVERDREEISAHERRRTLRAGEDARVTEGLEELGLEELALPRHRKGLPLDARDLVEMPRLGLLEPIVVGPGTRQGHAIPPRRSGAHRRAPERNPTRP